MSQSQIPPFFVQQVSGFAQQVLTNLNCVPQIKQAAMQFLSDGSKSYFSQLVTDTFNGLMQRGINPATPNGVPPQVFSELITQWLIQFTNAVGQSMMQQQQNMGMMNNPMGGGVQFVPNGGMGMQQPMMQSPTGAFSGYGYSGNSNQQPQQPVQQPQAQPAQSDAAPAGTGQKSDPPPVNDMSAGVQNTSSGAVKLITMDQVPEPGRWYDDTPIEVTNVPHVVHVATADETSECLDFGSILPGKRIPKTINMVTLSDNRKAYVGEFTTADYANSEADALKKFYKTIPDELLSGYWYYVIPFLHVQAIPISSKEYFEFRQKVVAQLEVSSLTAYYDAYAKVRDQGAPGLIRKLDKYVVERINERFTRQLRRMSCPCNNIQIDNFDDIADVLSHKFQSPLEDNNPLYARTVRLIINNVLEDLFASQRVSTKAQFPGAYNACDDVVLDTPHADVRKEDLGFIKKNNDTDLSAELYEQMTNSYTILVVERKFSITNLFDPKMILDYAYNVFYGNRYGDCLKLLMTVSAQLQTPMRALTSIVAIGYKCDPEDRVDRFIPILPMGREKNESIGDRNRYTQIMRVRAGINWNLTM